MSFETQNMVMTKLPSLQLQCNENQPAILPISFSFWRAALLIRRVCPFVQLGGADCISCRVDQKRVGGYMQELSK
jgi:hypothetical protein